MTLDWEKGRGKKKGEGKEERKNDWGKDGEEE